MPISCDLLRTNLAYQTPLYDKVFLEDFISDMPEAPFMGRHKTETWNYESDRVYFDKVHVEQPNYTAQWQVIEAGSGCSNPCDPPRTFVGFGTTRDSAVMEQIDLYSQPYCLQQLARVPHIQEQMSDIYKVIRKIPMGFMGDFLRTRFTSYHDTLQIAGSAYNTFAITTANTSTQLTTINLGNANLLPTSQLTWPILSYYSQLLGMRGYDKQSGLAAGMRNLVTHPRTFQKLVGLNPALQAPLRVDDIKLLSPLYKPGVGINANPFAEFAPTFDNLQLRFQHSGSGLLQRLLPYRNDPATTGEKPVVNPDWFNARYAISYILHPLAGLLYTSQPKKIGSPLIPNVNSAMWGQWKFVNPEGLIQWPNPDGTTCTKNNDKQFWFYWLCHLEAGFRYNYRDSVMPILHLIDGSGKDCTVNDPVCGDAPQYSSQDYSSNPIECP